MFHQAPGMHCIPWRRSSFSLKASQDLNLTISQSDLFYFIQIFFCHVHKSTLDFSVHSDYFYLSGGYPCAFIYAKTSHFAYLGHFRSKSPDSGIHVIRKIFLIFLLFFPILSCSRASPISFSNTHKVLFNSVYWPLFSFACCSQQLVNVLSVSLFNSLALLPLDKLIISPYIAAGQCHSI